jgi:hypothetical protein
MRIIIGDEFTPNLKEKIAWIRDNFDKDQYVIRDIGFLYNDYAVEFKDEKYATLYRLRWSEQ